MSGLAVFESDLDAGLMLGRALARGEGLAYVGVPGDPAAPKFPPAYPMLLALLWWVTDNPYGVGQVAAVLNVGFVAAACAVFAWWARALGVVRPVALAAGGALALSVPLWQPAMVALSEPLFVLVMAGVLLCALHVERHGGVRGALALAALLLLLVHVRTAGVALLGAAVIGLATRRRGLEAAIVAGLGGVGLLPWVLWSGRASAALPEPLRDILGGYGGFLGERIGRDLSVAVDVLVATGGQLGRTLAALFLPGAGTGVGAGVALPVLTVLIAGGVALVRRSPTGGLAFFLLLVEVWLWPFQATRLLVPVLPLAVIGLACAVAYGTELTAKRPRARIAVLGVAALATGAFAVASMIRMESGDVTDRYLIRTRILAEAIELIELTPPDAIVGAPELWAVVPLLTGRRSAPSAPFQPDPLGRRPSAGTPIEQLEVWEAAGLDHLLLEDGGRIHSATLTALEAACPGTVTIFGRGERQLLVRLGGDPACRRGVLALGRLP